MAMKKKGSIQDIAYVVLVFFGLLILSVAGFYGLNEYNDEIQNLNFSESFNSTKSVLDTYNTRAPQALDGGLAFLYVGLHISVIGLGLAMRTNPMFFIILWVILVGLCFLAGFLANAWDDIASQAELATTAAKFPMTGWIMDNYLMVTLLMGFFDIMVFVGLSTWMENTGVGL